MKNWSPYSEYCTGNLLSTIKVQGIYVEQASPIPSNNAGAWSRAQTCSKTSLNQFITRLKQLPQILFGKREEACVGNVEKYGIVGY